MLFWCRTDPLPLRIVATRFQCKPRAPPLCRRLRNRTRLLSGVATYDLVVVRDAPMKSWAAASKMISAAWILSAESLVRAAKTPPNPIRYLAPGGRPAAGGRPGISGRSFIVDGRGGSAGVRPRTDLTHLGADRAPASKCSATRNSPRGPTSRMTTWRRGSGRQGRAAFVASRRSPRGEKKKQRR